MREPYLNEYYGSHRPDYVNELRHYGVKGMRWGIINEDPLVGRKPGKKKESLTTKARKAARDFIKSKKVREAKAFMAKAGRLTAETALDILSEQTIVGEITAGAIRRKMYTTERDKATKTDSNGVKLQDPPPKTTKENLTRSNPNYFTRKEEYTKNCTNCSMTFEARERGYEVEAAPVVNRSAQDNYRILSEVYEGATQQPVWDFDLDKLPENWPETTADWQDYYSMLEYMNNKAGTDNENLINAVLTALAKEPPGSRGQIVVRWKTGGGHAMNYEIDKKGNPIFYCPQTNQKFSGYKLKSFLKNVSTFSYSRLDNCKINSEALIKDGVSR